MEHRDGYYNQSEHWVKCTICKATGPPLLPEVFHDKSSGNFVLPKGWHYANIERGQGIYIDCAGYEFTQNHQVFAGILCPDCGKELTDKLEQIIGKPEQEIENG